MAYNVAGQVASEVRPGAVTVTKTYDNLGRLTVESGSGGGSTTASRTLAYDSGSRMTAAGGQLFTYDPRGMLAGSTGPQGATTFGYDSLGRRTSRVDAAGSVTYGWNGRWDLTSAASTVFGWLGSGELDTVTYPGGTTRKYTYDDLGRATDDQVKNSVAAIISRRQYAYNPDSTCCRRR